VNDLKKIELKKKRRYVNLCQKRSEDGDIGPYYYNKKSKETSTDE